MAKVFSVSMLISGGKPRSPAGGGFLSDENPGCPQSDIFPLEPPNRGTTKNLFGFQNVWKPNINQTTSWKDTPV